MTTQEKAPRPEDAAPGAPGIDARWTSSAKNGVGTALSAASPLWFTLSHGILNEVYYPRVDSACTRDFGLIVTAEGGYFSEEKRDCDTETAPVAPGIPAFRVTNTARDGRYRIEKQVIADPDRPCLLQRIRFTAREGAVGDYRVHALLAPHLVNAGMGNSAWVGIHAGHKMLFATGKSRYLALAASKPWRATSAGFVGRSDGWQQLAQAGEITPRYARADDGNVALVGEMDFGPETGSDDDGIVLALAFGQTEIEAADRALASLEAGFDRAWDAYVGDWRGWQEGLRKLGRKGAGEAAFRTSAAVLATHRAVDRPGAVVASLSIPWGFSKGDGDLGGYHLVWPRDLVETAGGFLAIGDADEALNILDYLRQTQAPSGRWAQNMWLDGRPYWNGVQMDEVAFPILLADMLRRQGHLGDGGLDRYIGMVTRAAGFVLLNGPATAQDRWEEDAGYSPFTLAVEIAALLAAADMLDVAGRAEDAQHLRETADCWNEQIEQWTFAGDPNLCDAAGVSGYYVRIATSGATDSAEADNGETLIKNRPPDRAFLPSEDVLSPDALALVRFGLRAPDDPRITDTIAAIDHALKVELPQGPLWYRYTEDGYGEHADGSPFDGTGIGRAWPLLTGERAHYELAAGRPKVAKDLLATLEASAGDGGLLPEQSWDTDDIPDRELIRGRPAGSAMPLVWAHSEHLKLLRSLADGAVFDMPPQPRKRYIEDKTGSDIRIWRFDNQIVRLPAGKRLRLELRAPARVRWSTDKWAHWTDSATRPTGFGSHVVDLACDALAPGATMAFTLYWTASQSWEGRNFEITRAVD